MFGDYAFPLTEEIERLIERNKIFTIIFLLAAAISFLGSLIFAIFGWRYGKYRVLLKS